MSGVEGFDGIDPGSVVFYCKVQVRIHGKLCGVGFTNKAYGIAAHNLVTCFNGDIVIQAVIIAYIAVAVVYFNIISPKSVFVNGSNFSLSRSVYFASYCSADNYAIMGAPLVKGLIFNKFSVAEGVKYFT